MVVESVTSDPEDIGSDQVPLLLTPPPQPDARMERSKDANVKNALGRVP